MKKKWKGCCPFYLKCAYLIPFHQTHFDLTRHLWSIKHWLTFLPVLQLFGFLKMHVIGFTVQQYDLKDIITVFTLCSTALLITCMTTGVDCEDKVLTVGRESCVTQWPRVWHTSLGYTVWRLLVIIQQNSFWLAFNEASNWQQNEFLCQMVHGNLWSAFSTI